MTLQQLRCFLAVVKEKNFTRAAEGLFVSQPALSKQIAMLEKFIGFALFERNARGVALTEKGQRFYERMGPLYREMESVLQELGGGEGADALATAELRVGTLPSIGSYYLPPVAARIKSHRLAVVNKATSAELLELLMVGELDAAIVQDAETVKGLGAGRGAESVRDVESLRGVGEVRSLARFRRMFLFEEPYLAAFPAGHPLAEKERVTLADLRREPMLLHQHPCDLRDSLLEQFQVLGWEPVISMEAPYESILGYTANGAGVSFVPFMTVNHVSHRDIVYRKIEGEPLKRKLYLYARSQAVLDVFAGAIQEKRSDV